MAMKKTFRAAALSGLVAASLLSSVAPASAHNVPYTKYNTYSTSSSCYTIGNQGVTYRSWHNFYCSRTLSGYELWVQT